MNTLAVVVLCVLYIISVEGFVVPPQRSRLSHRRLFRVRGAPVRLASAKDNDGEQSFRVGDGIGSKLLGFRDSLFSHSAAATAEEEAAVPAPSPPSSSPSSFNVGVNGLLNGVFQLGKTDEATLQINNNSHINGKKNSNTLQRDGTLGIDREGLLARFDEAIEGAPFKLFEYADLSVLGPDRREFTLLGVLFLATNIPFLISGQALFNNGNLSGALSLDLAGVMSFIYHYLQVNLGPNRIEVRRSLAADYTTATITCLVLGLEALQFLSLLMADTHNLELGLPALTGAAALSCLVMSGVYDDDGVAYIKWHSAWHVLGAVTAYLVATV